MTASAASKTFLSDRIAFSHVLHILFYVLSQSTCPRACKESVWYGKARASSTLSAGLQRKTYEKKTLLSASQFGLPTINNRSMCNAHVNFYFVYTINNNDERIRES
uniref:(northern house mosquito) hypothetical protein n=1 Tax=Culex pipiens TaxID=7175 RepID=A0A8D8IGK7_CULPI